MTYTPFEHAGHELVAEEEARRDEELSLHTPSELDKAGPDFVEGASEAAEEALKVPRAASRISDDPKFLQWVESQGLTEDDLIDMAEKRENTNLLNTNITGYETAFSGLEGLRDTTMPITQGLVDTGVGAMSLITGGITDPIKDFWHDKNPQSDNAISHTVRKLSGVVLPSIMAPQVVVPALANTPWAVGLPAAVKTTGAIAARLGIDTGVVASSTSADDENAAKALNDAFGWNLPWATREGAGPDERRWYSLTENLGMAGAGELIQGIFSLKTLLKTRYTDRFIDKKSWLHDFDLNRSELHSGQAGPGSMVEWDPGLVAVPMTDEAVEGLVRNADKNTQETVSPAIKEIDDQIEQLGLLDELGEADELRLAELVAERVKVEVDEMPFDSLTKNLDETAKARENGLLTI